MAYTTIKKPSDYFNTKFIQVMLQTILQLQVLDFNQILLGLKLETLVIIIDFKIV
jgi:hypothetical protein